MINACNAGLPLKSALLSNSKHTVAPSHMTDDASFGTTTQPRNEDCRPSYGDRSRVLNDKPTFDLDRYYIFYSWASSFCMTTGSSEKTISRSLLIIPVCECAGELRIGSPFLHVAP